MITLIWSFSRVLALTWSSLQEVLRFTWYLQIEPQAPLLVVPVRQYCKWVKPFAFKLCHNDVFLERFYTGGSETVIKRTVFGCHMVFVSEFLTKNVGFVKIGVEMVPNFTSNPQKWAPGYQNSIVWGIKLLNCLRTSLFRTCLLSRRTAPPTFKAKIKRRPRDKEADP